MMFDSKRKVSIYNPFILWSCALAITACSYSGATKQLSVNGQIESEETRISTLVASKVIRVGVREGQLVKKGDELLELDSQAYRKQLKCVDDLLQAMDKEKRCLSNDLCALQNTKNSSRINKRILGGTRIGFTDISGDNGAIVNKLKHQRQASNERLSSDQSAQSEMLKQLSEISSTQMEQLKESSESIRQCIDLSFAHDRETLLEARAFAKRSVGQKGIFANIRRAKQNAIDEVFDAKEQALQKAYDAQVAALSQSTESKERLVVETLDAKKSAILEMQQEKNKIAGQLTEQQEALETTLAGQLSQLDLALRKQQMDARRQITSLTDNLRKMKNDSGLLTLQFGQIRARLAALDTERARAVAMREELRSKIELCSIESPVEGSCTSCNVRAGDVVTPGPVLIKLADKSSMFVRAFVTEADLTTLKVGQPAYVQIEGTTSKPIAGRLVSIDTTPCFSPKGAFFREDRSKVAYKIRLSLEGDQGVARSGMPVDVHLATTGDWK